MDWKKLQNIDRRIIYVLLILVTAIPMLSPLGIPISAGTAVEKFHAIMESIPAGEKVCLSLNYGPSTAPELHPTAVAIVRQMLDKGVDVAFISFGVLGPTMAERIIVEHEAQGYEYGVHFANLGYIPGGEMAIKRFGEDVIGSVPKDYRNNTTKNLPMMKDIDDCRDFAVVIEFATGTPGLPEWVRQVQGPLDINLLAVVVTVEVPKSMPFVNAGQVKALLGGMRDGAGYEIQTGYPGYAVAKMDSQSLAHLLIIGFILVGNVAYFLDKRNT